MKIAFTSGDINGIGIECFIKTIQRYEKSDLPKHEITLFCNEDILKKYLEISPQKIDIINHKLIFNSLSISIKNIEFKPELNFGELREDSGRHAAESIGLVLDEISNGKYDAMVTLPINKKAIELAGWEFPGHTERIAFKFDTEPLMILFDKDIRVALATIHVPVNQVSSTLSKEIIIKKGKALINSLRRDFGKSNPKVGVLSLNPHAGENGNIGTEELDYINDAVDSLKAIDNSEVEGPFAADGYYGFGTFKEYDATLAMFHDQGLIPLKLLSKGAGVNFTANLPIVRTSPDHGTAFHIAGKWVADERSTYEAFVESLNISLNRINLTNS